MFGDDPIKDIQGSKQAINAITFQKIHSGVKIGTKNSSPDIAFKAYKEICNFVRKLNV